VKNISIFNCVLWCGWGRNLEVGIETACQEYSEILFENCDLIRSQHVCMDIQTGDYAYIHNVIFKNIKIELQNDGRQSLVQDAFDKVYESKGRNDPILIFIGDYRFRIAAAGFSQVGFLSKEEYAKRRGADGKIGTVQDIVFDDIWIFAEKGVPKPTVKLRSKSIEGGIVDNVTIKNIMLNGKKAGRDDLDLRIEGTISKLEIV
jgi:hypothetical protein